MNNDKKNELISIIVPIYKVELYLDRCVESIVNQTYLNIEIILVDDGSPDNCPYICDNWKNRDKRIVVIHKTNGGLSDARNAGLNSAHGNYVMFIDSDDYIEHNMVEALYSAIVKENADLAICGFDYVYKDNNKWNKSFVPLNGIYSKEDIFLKLYEKDGWLYNIACNKLYNKTIWENYGFPYGKIHEDEFVLHYILEKSHKIVCVQKVLYHYFQRSSSIMNNISTKSELDALEALIDRENYFLSKKKLNLAFLQEKSLCALVWKAFRLMDREQENKSRFKLLKNQFINNHKIIKKYVDYSIKDILRYLRYVVLIDFIKGNKF